MHRDISCVTVINAGDSWAARSLCTTLKCNFASVMVYMLFEIVLRIKHLKGNILCKYGASKH